MFKSFTDGFSGWIVGKTGADATSGGSTDVAPSPTPTSAGADAEAAVNDECRVGDIAAPTGATSVADDEGQHTKKDVKSTSSDAVKLDELTGVAKQWGSYLLSVGKAATKTIANTALEIKKTVGEKSILGDFAKEQEKFVNEKRERQQRSEAAVPPWVGYNEEETMKQQILGLSADKRNFLRNPPAGVQFHFDYDTWYPVATAMLAEDENLQKMRFELVPKQVNEHDFWRNYFYRVSLIKQSAQLTSMAKQSSATRTYLYSKAQAADGRTSITGTSVSGESQRKTATASKDENKEIPDHHRPPEAPASSLPQVEFISDDYQGVVNDDDLKKEMEALRVKDTKAKEVLSAEDTPEWEKELQKELNEYEVVGGSGGAEDLDVDEAELEKEILEQIADNKI